MGATVSVELDGDGRTPEAGNKGPMQRMRPRQSVAFSGGAAEELRLPGGNEAAPDVFQIRVPAGVVPGGTFSAVCGGRYVTVEVPPDCFPGDTIEVDLNGIDQAAAAGPPKGECATDLDDLPGDEQRLKECAAIFLKYGTKGSYSLTLTQLEQILEQEFHFPHHSQEIKTEMRMADIDRSSTISFHEFVVWYDHIKLRLEVERLHNERKALAESDKKNGLQVQHFEEGASQALLQSDGKDQDASAGDGAGGDGRLPPAGPGDKSSEAAGDRSGEAAGDKSGEAGDDDKEDAAITTLREQQAALRAQVEKQKEEFAKEIEALKREKERLEAEHAASKKEQAEVNDEIRSADATALSEVERTNQRLRVLENQHRANELMIEKMKQDYIYLRDRRMSEAAHKREEARKKVEAKKKARAHEIEHRNAHGHGGGATHGHGGHAHSGSHGYEAPTGHGHCEDKDHKHKSCTACGAARRACGCERRVMHCPDCLETKCDSCHK